MRSNCCSRAAIRLAHAVMMLMPEAWAGNPLMDAKRRAFYEYHAALMEPWDGPAAVAFTDGRQIGATLDRNGLRPARFLVTDDDLVVMASESGVLPIKEDNIVRKWRLQPGRMLLIDFAEGPDHRGRGAEGPARRRSSPMRNGSKRRSTSSRTSTWSSPNWRSCRSRPPRCLDRQQAFGYTQEDLSRFLEPMAHECRRSARLDGHRHPDRGALGPSRGCSTITSSRTSPRSPTRRSIRSAKSW